jgi:hypothetical protein
MATNDPGYFRENPVEAEIRGDRSATSKVLFRAARDFARLIEEKLRPSILLGALVSQNFAGAYTAEAAGIIALGNTPAEAFAEFDRIWTEGN